MRRMREFALFLIILMVSLATGCTIMSNENSPSPIPTETLGSDIQKYIDVNIFQYKVEYKDAFEEVAKKFSQEYKTIALNIETVGNGQDYGAALRTKFNSGIEPAIFNISGPQDLIDWKNKLADVSDAEVVKYAIKGFLDAVTLEKKIYGLPYYVEGYGLIHRPG